MPRAAFHAGGFFRHVWPAKPLLPCFRLPMHPSVTYWTGARCLASALWKATWLMRPAALRSWHEQSTIAAGRLTALERLAAPTPPSCLLRSACTGPLATGIEQRLLMPLTGQTIDRLSNMQGTEVCASQFPVGGC